MSEPIVIVGAGQAGCKAAETLRRLGWEGSILMFGDEPHPPYQRPPLSKKVLSGEASDAQLWLQGMEFYSRNAIDLVTDTEVTRLDPVARRVTTSDGHDIHFARLLLATGSRPRALDVPGCDLAGVHVLRTLRDVVDLRSALDGVEHVVIVGGGYIGLEVAAVLRSLGRQVTILEAQDRLLKRALCPTVSEAIAHLHLSNGVEIVHGARLAGFLGTDRVAAVQLEDSRIPAELVLVAVGGAANDQLAAAAGLPVADGVRVDAHARAGGEVFAAGDCARFLLPRYGIEVRLESVQNANDQARAAAAAMLGKAEVYDPVPWFWSDQYDCKLQIAGLSNGYDRCEVEGDPAKRAFSVSYWRGERLLSVASLNAPRAHMEARRRIAALPPLVPA